MTEGRLQERRVVVGISGGIAGYKAIEVSRRLTEGGAEVRVMMTPEATRFVTPLTLEAVSYHPVAADWLAAQGAGETPIALAEWAELIAIVPATANTIAKLALGLAGEIGSATVLASRAPLVLGGAGGGARGRRDVKARGAGESHGGCRGGGDGGRGGRLRPRGGRRLEAAAHRQAHRPPPAAERRHLESARTAGRVVAGRLCRG